ncbi:MAG: hypothetical protein Q8N03_13785 [Ignavibacteria bacterium]|nr:hypothetical protein [Ignavibacteria bacterium]
MSDYKLTFKLKQHTPIIHFQHDQYGATLRASELKPKLDKFLIENEFGGILKFNDYKQYLIGDTKGIEKEIERIDSDLSIPNKESAKTEFLSKQKLAFDYKVKILSNSQKIDGVDKNKTYFGGMGHKGEKEYAWTDKPIELLIIVLNKDLRDEIKKIFPYFLAETNFGTRQNKGNGSFYIDESDHINYKAIENVLPSGTFYISIKEKTDDRIFIITDYYYRRLKAGINLNFDSRCSGEYHKSFLYKYFNDKTKKGWEKRFIKEEFFGIYKDGIAKYFIRAVLGLPGNFTYKKTLEPCNKKNDKKIAVTYEIKDDYEIEVHHPEIERYKSPITFKPIKYTDKTIIFVLPQTDAVISTSEKFALYKKFTVKTIFLNYGKFIIKSKVVPERLGTAKTEIDWLISNLAIQETKVKQYLEEIEKIYDEKKKKNLTKTINNYIIDQKDRFKKYLEECLIINNKYIPPHIEMEIPNNDNINIDLKELIKKYNEDELSKSFSFENISATIDVTN